MLRQFLRACAVTVVTALPMLSAPSVAAESKYWRDGKTVTAVPMAAWDAGGKVMVAKGKDAVAKAPGSAVKFTVKTVKWPSGSIKVIEFTKAGGGVLYKLTDEAQFFVVKGSVKATVESVPVVLKAGDVGATLSGVLRSGDVAEDTMIVAWVVGPVSTEEPKPTVVHAAAASGDLGARGNAENPRPREDGQTVIRRYVFPGNSIRLAVMSPNRFSSPHTGPLDNFMYIIEGHVQYSEGGETYQAYGGDFLFQETGTLHEWDQKDGARFVASSVLPVGVKHRMDPSKAN